MRHIIPTSSLQVEGEADFALVALLLRGALRGAVDFDALDLELIGPEIDMTSPADGPAKANIGRAIERARSAGVALEFGGCELPYHRAGGPRAGPPPADLALVLNGGCDCNFHLWGETLRLLVARGTPTALTGYERGGAPIDHPERLLRLLGARVALPTTRNPFRFDLMGNVADAFLVGVAGAVRR